MKLKAFLKSRLIGHQGPQAEKEAWLENAEGKQIGLRTRYWPNSPRSDEAAGDFLAAQAAKAGFEIFEDWSR